ncbi:MAG: hypothetical protein V1816_17655 [Pseudomonadota bacterium]
MKEYQKEFARVLAESGALFFAPGLRLKDGRPTPYFVNMGLFCTGALSLELGDRMAGLLEGNGLLNQVDVLVGPSYKGSALAVAAAQCAFRNYGVNLFFDYDRKEVKTHGEATGRADRFVTGGLRRGAKIFILDDVGTSMATKYDLLSLLESESRDRGLDLKVVGVGLAVDRQQTSAVLDEDGRVREGERGRDAIRDFTSRTGIPVYCLARIKEVVEYLAEEKIPVTINGEKRPINAGTLAGFRDYLSTYGTLERP